MHSDIARSRTTQEPMLRAEEYARTLRASENHTEDSV